MTQPRRFAVLRLDSTNAVQFRNPISRNVSVCHIANTEKCPYIGELTEDVSVVWCDSEAEAQGLIEYLVVNYPRNSYALTQVQSVYYIPDVPPVRAKFSDAGLLPA